MAAMVWLAVTGYLLMALGELVPVRFRSSKDDALAPFHICAVALGYALSWPMRLLRRPREG